MANAATCLWLRRARQTRGTHIDRFLAVKLDSDPGLLNDIQVEACDGQGCVAAGNKQRLGQVKSPLKLQTTATPGSPHQSHLAEGHKSGGSRAPPSLLCLTWQCSTLAQCAAPGGRLCIRTAGCYPRGLGRHSRKRGLGPVRWMTGVRRTRSHSLTA